MAQHTSGLRSLLSLPKIYGFCQDLIGGSEPWRLLVKDYIRPYSGMRILDMGCGTAMILDYLPENVFYVGVDMSREYIDAAKRQYGKRGEFHCISVESIKDAVLDGFDLVMGLSVLHHLDDTQALRFFSIASKALNDRGRCLTVDPCLAKGQHPVARFLIRMDRGRNVRYREEYATLAAPYFPQRTHYVCHDWLRIPYTHHVMECRRQ